VSPEVVQIATLFFVLLMSLSVHEAAHALAAKMQGDPTAEKMGRLTLNPVPHIDILGTIILPLIMMFGGGGFFGWAKPVPVDGRNLRNVRWGHALVATAGPASNIALALTAIVILNVHGAYFTTQLPRGSFFYPLIDILQAAVWVNAILAFFNMIPLPPLDGGAVMAAVLPERQRQWFEQYVEPYGAFILLGLIFSGALRSVIWVTGNFVNSANALVSQIIS
jgi:Zn-dependent protease